MPSRRRRAWARRLFVEMGPRPILTSPITETLKERARWPRPAELHGSGRPRAAPRSRALGGGQRSRQWRAAAARAWGAVDRTLPLPTYPWQRTTYHFQGTTAALDLFGGAAPRHPLIGGRLAEGMPEWRTFLDYEVVPYLATMWWVARWWCPAPPSSRWCWRWPASFGPRGLWASRTATSSSPSCWRRRPCARFPCAMRPRPVMWSCSAARASAPTNGRCTPARRLVDVAHAPRTPAKPRGRLIRATAEEIYARTRPAASAMVRPSGWRSPSSGTPRPSRWS